MIAADASPQVVESSSADDSLPPGQRRFLSLKLAASYVDLSVKTLRNFIAAGKLTPRRPCKGKILLDRIELESLVSGSTATPRKGRGRAI